MNMRRCFYLLLSLCVCLSVLCLDLHTAYATETIEDTEINVSTFNLKQEDLDNGLLYIDVDRKINNNGAYFNLCSPSHFTTSLDNVTGNSFESWYFNTGYSMSDILTFTTTSNAKLFSKGSSLDFSVSNIANFIEDTSYDYFSFVPNSNVNVNVYCIDNYGNSYRAVTSVTSVKSDYSVYSFGRYSLSFSIDSLPTDTYKIIVYVDYYGSDFPNITSSTSSTYTWYGGFSDSIITFDETKADKTDSLLDSIISIVNNIKEGILNLPSLIANAIKGFFDNIVNAISNMVSALQEKLQSVLDGIVNKLTDLGNFLIDGIKGLFVPSEDDIASMKEDWENLLAERFGALYEVIQLVDDYADSFSSSSQSTITIPTITIPLGEDDFVFGGWEVQIIPEGFTVLIDALKLIISISATILFVNGLKNRFERIVTR